MAMAENWRIKQPREPAHLGELRQQSALKVSSQFSRAPVMDDGRSSVRAFLDGFQMSLAWNFDCGMEWALGLCRMFISLDHPCHSMPKNKLESIERIKKVWDELPLEQLKRLILTLLKQFTKFGVL
ncbi:hypothetical protein KC19_9G080300 [Ceratodon purpureus]|uniref:Uncharacterized protein n=1 Tax=Ceratodon purpureus TaxID=3225 RepID=A0A8T0GT99_CERPU|nr:hypothetical protein KC19_9G080300 [Ceratodon purpureus]